MAKRKLPRVVAERLNVENENIESDEKPDQVVQEPPPPPSSTIVVAQSKKKKKKPLSTEPRVIYIGHLPHGFFEAQLRRFFAQFGSISRLRLARNPKTGRSRHYAFIEFHSKHVAPIAAEAMDGYLIFGRKLVCQALPPAQVDPHTFLLPGSGGDTKNKTKQRKPFNAYVNMKQQRQTEEVLRHELVAVAEPSEKRIQRQQKKDSKKRKRLQELCIDYELPHGEVEEVKAHSAKRARTVSPAAEPVSHSSSPARDSLGDDPSSESFSDPSDSEAEREPFTPVTSPSNAKRIKKSPKISAKASNPSSKKPKKPSSDSPASQLDNEPGSKRRRVSPSLVVPETEEEASLEVRPAVSSQKKQKKARKSSRKKPPAQQVNSEQVPQSPSEPSKAKPSQKKKDKKSTKKFEGKKVASSGSPPVQSLSEPSKTGQPSQAKRKGGKQSAKKSKKSREVSTQKSDSNRKERSKGEGKKQAKNSKKKVKHSKKLK